MEKAYRDLYEGLTLEAAGMPPLLELVKGVGAIDDADPMRIPALKAMRHGEKPPIDLIYRFEDGERPGLALYAVNPSRKRKTLGPSLCARLALDGWCLFSDHDFPAANEASRSKYLALVQQSFGYLELRIGIYFTLRSLNRLSLSTYSAPVLAIDEIAERPRRVRHLAELAEALLAAAGILRSTAVDGAALSG